MKVVIYKMTHPPHHHLRSHLKADSNENGDLLNDTPTSMPSPQVEMAMSRVSHFSVVTYRQFYSQLQLITVNYNCHP